MLFACNASVRATTITCFENPSDDRGEVLSCASAGFLTAPAFSQSKPSSPGSSYTEIHSGRDVPRGGGAFRGKMTGSEYIVEIRLLEGGGGLSDFFRAVFIVDPNVPTLLDVINIQFLSDGESNFAAGCPDGESDTPSLYRRCVTETPGDFMEFVIARIDTPGGFKVKLNSDDDRALSAPGTLTLAVLGLVVLGMSRRLCRAWQL